MYYLVVTSTNYSKISKFKDKFNAQKAMLDIVNGGYNQGHVLRSNINVNDAWVQLSSGDMVFINIYSEKLMLSIDAED